MLLSSNTSRIRRQREVDGISFHEYESDVHDDNNTPHRSDPARVFSATERNTLSTTTMSAALSPRSTATRNRLDPGKSKSCAKELVDEEVELLGSGFFHMRMAMILGLGNSADAVEILAMGYILGSFDDPISAYESSLVTSAVFLGMFFGGIVGTILGDKYGRRFLMLLCLAVNGVAGLFAACSPTLVWMAFFRFVAGVGIGGIAPMLFAVCLEHVPKDARGKYITVISAFWMIGSIFTAVLAWVMLGCYWGTTTRILNVSWRAFSVCASIPCFVAFGLIYAYVPESPRYLVSKGRIQEASDTLTLIYSINGRSRLPNFSGPDDVADAATTRRLVERRESLHWNERFLLMFDSREVKNLKWTTILLLMSTFCLSFGSYGISTWVTRVFQSTNVHNPYANDILYASAALPGNLIGLYLVDSWGRRNLFAGTLFLAALCGFLFSCSPNGESQVFTVGICCLYQCATTMAWIGYDVLSAEVYPLHIRVSALCFISSTGRFGAALAQVVNGFLMGPPADIQTLLLVTTTVMAVGGVSVLLLDDDKAKPETETDPLLAPALSSSSQSGSVSPDTKPGRCEVTRVTVTKSARGFYALFLAHVRMAKKVHALPAPPTPRRRIYFCLHSRIYTVGYVLNLILMPFKAYLTEPLPWTLQPLSLDTAWLEAKTASPFAGFANTTMAFFASKYNHESVAPDRVFTRDTEANTYLLRFTIALPPDGDARCVNHMHQFPGAIFYSQGMAAFVCTFVSRNATTRLNYPMHQCQYDTVVGIDIATSCTWAMPIGLEDSSYQVYHAVQLLETPLFSWLNLCVRVGLMGLIIYLLWHLYYRHYAPLVYNLREWGLGGGTNQASYVVQLGDPTWLILNHPLVSLIMLLDCFFNVGYGGAACCRTSQLTDMGQFCLGCLYGSRTVWSSYFTMRYSTPLLKYMQWENEFQPVDPGVMALTASFYAGPLVYLISRTPLVLMFQWMNYVTVPESQRLERVEGAMSMLSFLLLLASVPLIHSFVAQYGHRHHTNHESSATERFVTTRFNDWKHRYLFWFRRLHLCSRKEGGTLYRLFAENPRYKKYPLVSTRGSDCFVYGWDADADAYVHQVRLSLVYAALDRQTTCPSQAIPICPADHPTYAAGVMNAHVCGQSVSPPSSRKSIHMGANECQWMQ
ncbi:Aste57867_3535 [Aphanomyces stellatus]|uniref:Aste57867_3535 protein n=1 Tax=Aphanomyces stellatus TaxID=120398 RepID=A0A485KFN8_9STRA|nr:hypothetical protein As57867_003524 [Aphanomyces stellatus]VFT80698.1 Aste57867_3535 [Aphanomyces stellatus]